jgi:hypothetical protein
VVPDWHQLTTTPTTTWLQNTLSCSCVLHPSGRRCGGQLAGGMCWRARGLNHNPWQGGYLAVRARQLLLLLLLLLLGHMCGPAVPCSRLCTCCAGLVEICGMTRPWNMVPVCRSTTAAGAVTPPCCQGLLLQPSCDLNVVLNNLAHASSTPAAGWGDESTMQPCATAQLTRRRTGGDQHQEATCCQESTHMVRSGLVMHTHALCVGRVSVY